MIRVEANIMQSELWEYVSESEEQLEQSGSRFQVANFKHTVYIENTADDSLVANVDKDVQ